jgi:hypothetical protein
MQLSRVTHERRSPLTIIGHYEVFIFRVRNNHCSSSKDLHVLPFYRKRTFTTIRQNDAPSEIGTVCEWFASGANGNDLKIVTSIG